MTPMPPHIAKILAAHENLLAETKAIAWSSELSPSTVLLAAFIGNGTISASKMKEMGCYFGSNASYNLKKLLDGGYARCRDGADRRRRYYSLTPKGIVLAERVRVGLAQKMMEAA
jgi:DNA-binding MarR family transcriptional regulator